MMTFSFIIRAPVIFLTVIGKYYEVFQVIQEMRKGNMENITPTGKMILKTNPLSLSYS